MAINYEANYRIVVENAAAIRRLREQERALHGVEKSQKDVADSARDLGKAQDDQTASSKEQEGALGRLSSAMRRFGQDSERARRSQTGLTEAKQAESVATARLSAATENLNVARARQVEVNKKTVKSDLEVKQAASAVETALYRVLRAENDLDLRHKTVITSTRNLSLESGRAGKAMDFLGSKTHILSQKLRDLGTFLKVLKWPLLIGGAASAAGAIGSLVSGVIALVPALARGASSVLSIVGPLTRAAVALTSVVGPLAQVGALAAALPSALIGLAAAAGSVALAFSGVGGALKAYVDQQKAAGTASAQTAQQQQSAARQVESAERSLQTARLSVIDSTQALADAQQNLNDARQQALRDLQDMRSAEAHGELAVKEAKISLARAKQALSEIIAGGGDPSGLAFREAVLAVQEAQLGVSDARRQNKRNQDDLRESEKKGVAQSDIVVQAQRNLEDAYRGVQNAIQGVRDAQIALSDSQASLAQGTAEAQKYADALSQLSPPAQAFVKALGAMYPLLKKLKETAAEGLFTPVLDVIGRLRLLFPVVNRAIAGTSEVIGDLIAKAIRLVTSPAWRQDFGRLFQGNLQPLRLVGDALLNLLDAMRHITVAAQPLTQWIARLVHQWSETAQKTAEAARESGRLDVFFTRVRQTATTLGHIVRNLWDVVVGFFKAGSDTGRVLLQRFDALTERWADWVNSIGTQNRLRDWFDEARQSMDTVGHILANLGRVIIDFFRAGSSTGDKMLESLSGITDKWAEFLHQTSTQNRLAEWFEKAREDGRKLLEVLGHLFRGLLNIFHAANTTGEILWSRINDAAERFEDFTKSTEGQNKLKQWFANSIPVIHQVSLLLRDILRYIGQTARDQQRGMLPLLIALRTKLLPGLEAFLGFMTSLFQEIAPGTLDALAEVVGLVFRLLSKTVTLLPEVVKLFKFFVDMVIDLTNIPGFGHFVVLFLSLLGALRLGFTIAKFTGISWLISKIGVLTTALKGLIIWAAGANKATAALAAGALKAGKLLGVAAVAFSAVEGFKAAREGNTVGGIAGGAAGGALGGFMVGGPAGAVVGGLIGGASGIAGAVQRRDQQSAIEAMTNYAKALQHEYQIGKISADQLRESVSHMNSEMESFSGGVKINANALIGQADAANKATQDSDNLARSTKNLANETQDAASEHTQMEVALRREAEASADFRAVLDDNRKGLEAYSRITGKTMNSVIADLQRARQKGPEAIKDMTNQMIADVNQWSLDMSSNFDVANEALDSFAGDAKATPEKILDALDTSAEGLQQYGRDWEEVVKKAGGQNKEFIDHLRSMGTDGATIVHALADANQEQFDDIAGTWKKTQDKSQSLAQQITGPLVNAFHKLINAIRKANDLKPINWDRVLARQKIAKAWDDAVQAYRDAQRKNPLPPAIFRILADRKLAGTQIQGMVEEVKNKLLIRSPSKVMLDIGKQTGQGLLDGLSETLRKIGPILDAMVRTITDALDKVKEKFDDTTDSIDSIWSRLATVVESPVKYIVNTVLAKMVEAFNKVLEYLGKDPMTVPTFSGGGRVGPGAGTPQQQMARGGFVPGEGDGDTVPAMLTPGEFVIRKKSAQRIGYGNLERLNRYAAGGAVAAADTGNTPGGGPTVGSADVAAAGGAEAFLTREFDVVRDGLKSDVPFLGTLAGLAAKTMDQMITWAVAEEAVTGAGIPAGLGPFFVFPVEKPYAYGDSFGAPRYVGGYHPHAGVDIMTNVPYQQQRVFAPFAGTVSKDPNTLGGNAIILSGAEGYIYGAHLSKYGKLGAVRVGEVIGTTGSSGDATAGAEHLHIQWKPKSMPQHPYRSSYGYTVIDGYIDPYPYLKAVEAAQAAIPGGTPRGGGAGPGTPPAGGVEGWLAEAARMRGETDIPGWVRRMKPIAYAESRYTPWAFNDTPVSSGQHAAGLMQMIGSTYSAYRKFGTPAVSTYSRPPDDSPIFDPVLNPFSALGLIKYYDQHPGSWRYPSDPGGPPFARGGRVPFADGGIVSPWSPGSGLDLPKMGVPQMSGVGSALTGQGGVHPAFPDRQSEVPIELRLELDGQSILQSTRTHARKMRVTMAGRA